ncbi:DUF4404 family protein [Streptomyces sp. NBC_01264]|uniref:DUF4404 family protein n=1 Tax=Streptomyces sp. NBC_01264 TaxID=2903804 RepID=UPI0022569A52|nr:DUF4404 family protein [Streptomyces sp. NBC_01264]MCX4781628.1 DUF4404 family protein [Streptomyces sp. NBC_01264]
MPARELEEQLRILRELGGHPSVQVEEHAHLRELIRRLEDPSVPDTASGDEHLTDSVRLAAERFEIGHPAVAATLQSIGLALANMGI